MEDKIFDLLEKVYIEVQETKKDVKDIKVRQDKMDERLSRLEIKVEHDISKKLDALFDFRDEALKRFDKIDNKLDELSEKVDRHDIRIQVIEGGKGKRKV